MEVCYLVKISQINQLKFLLDSRNWHLQPQRLAAPMPLHVTSCHDQGAVVTLRKNLDEVSPRNPRSFGVSHLQQQPNRFVVREDVACMGTEDFHAIDGQAPEALDVVDPRFVLCQSSECMRLQQMAREIHTIENVREEFSFVLSCCDW